MLDKQIRNLLLNDHKPADLKPIDLLIVAYLLSRHAEEREVIDSWDTIATRLHCNRKTVGESIKRLESLGWITRSDRYAYDKEQKRREKFKRASLLVLNIEALPDGTTPHSKPSPYAEKLAAEYHAVLLPKVGVTKKRPRTWTKVNEHAAQQILDALESKNGPDGKYKMAYMFANYAVCHSSFKKSARDSLREITTRLPALRQEWREWYEAQTAQTQIETTITEEIANA